MLVRLVAGLAAATTIALFATAPAVAGSTDIVVAQAADAPQGRYHRRPTRLTVYPYERVHRECNSWLELQHRPSGDVLYPQMHCYWTQR